MEGKGTCGCRRCCLCVCLLYQRVSSPPSSFLTHHPHPSSPTIVIHPHPSVSSILTHHRHHSSPTTLIHPHPPPSSTLTYSVYGSAHHRHPSSPTTVINPQPPPSSILTQSVHHHGVVSAVVAAADVGGGDRHRAVHTDDVGERRAVGHADADAVVVAQTVGSLPQPQPLQPLPLWHHTADTWPQAALPSASSPSS